jgi:hypothetical protein
MTIPSRQNNRSKPKVSAWTKDCRVDRFTARRSADDYFA